MSPLRNGSSIHIIWPKGNRSQQMAFLALKPMNRAWLWCLINRLFNSKLMTSRNRNRLCLIGLCAVDYSNNGPVLPNFDVYSSPNKLLNTQSNYRWYETLWRSCDVIIMNRHWLLRPRSTESQLCSLYFNFVCTEWDNETRIKLIKVDILSFQDMAQMKGPCIIYRTVITNLPADVMTWSRCCCLSSTNLNNTKTKAGS